VIGLDTNIIVRYLAQDDKAQSPTATRLMERLTPEDPGFVGGVVLAEISWVLSRAYKTPRDEMADAIESLLRSAELVIENAEAAYALIAEAAALAGARETVTFDKDAAADGGMRLLR
jgi:predicted nucleic-acid-binding protein